MADDGKGKLLWRRGFFPKCQYKLWCNINDDANISGLNPIPGLNAHNITAVIKRNGSITGYMLSNGEILNKDEAINRAKSGGINNIAVAMRKGNEYLRSLPDDSEANNLSSMPFFDD